MNGAIQDGSDAVITPATARSFQSSSLSPGADPGCSGNEGDIVGLVLFPGGDDISSPDVSWSYADFGVFRRWLAQADGFALDEMNGFGGQRHWNDVSTTLAPLLNHPDDGSGLTPLQCAAILPRLQEIAEHPQEGSIDPLLQPNIDDARQLVVTLQLCIKKDVGLLFG